MVKEPEKIITTGTVGVTMKYSWIMTKKNMFKRGKNLDVQLELLHEWPMHKSWCSLGSWGAAHPHFNWYLMWKTCPGSTSSIPPGRLPPCFSQQDHSSSPLRWIFSQLDQVWPLCTHCRDPEEQTTSMPHQAVSLWASLLSA